MERTQRLLGIALAVIALDGCRGSERVAGPGATGTPSSSYGSSYHHSSTHIWSHYHHIPHIAGGAAAAAAAAAAARAGNTRTLGGRGGARGGFGGAGAHGGGG